ncbi:MAG: ribonuclease Z [Planctomycetes bacterium]|nr:ribonuclease Z [Planctomycetota bacterium]
MRATILGTSSAVPTFRRGLSGTLLERETEVFLFDCGEGTQFRLMRANARRGRLSTIFITHLHGDHIFGLPGLLSSLNLNQREDSVFVYGPQGIARFVDFVTNFPRRMTWNFDIQVQELPPAFTGVVVDHPEYRVMTRPLDHRLPTQGYRVEEKDLLGRFDGERADELGVPFGPERGQLIRGESVTLADGRTIHPRDLVGPPRAGKSFAYCTDTAFCVNAKRLAQDVDLLVHESTYGDDGHAMAFDRKHATIRQAATIARASQAKKFVATHFSTRYDKVRIRELEAQGREVYPDLIMAHDLIEIEV